MTDTLPLPSGVAGTVETHDFVSLPPTYVVPFHPAPQGSQSIFCLNRVAVETKDFAEPWEEKRAKYSKNHLTKKICGLDLN